MIDCASCKVYRCRDGGNNAPSFCPGTNEEELIKKSVSCYQGEDNTLARTAAVVVSTSYGKWTRVREVMEFARRMDYQKIGLAFCYGLRDEARMFSNILESNGFEVTSAICKIGAVDKKEIGILPEEKINPEKFEAICNPAAQALLLEKRGSQLNVLLGLCVGHDTLFIKHSKAPVTVLAVKDRVLAHNPLGALYTGHYYQRKLVGILDVKNEAD